MTKVPVVGAVRAYFGPVKQGGGAADAVRCGGEWEI